jgi:hypothetical protein
MQIVALDQQTSFWIRLFFNLSPAFRRIIIYLYSLEAEANKKKWKGIFPSKKRMAFFGTCCVKTAQRFNKEMRGLEGLIMTIWPWFDEKGRQTSNRYRMSREFLKALVWLDRRNLLEASSDLVEEIVKEANPIEMSPSPHQTCPPFSYPSLNPAREEYGYVHPYIEKIGMLTREEKKSLSQYPEYAIVAGVDDCVWYSRQGRKIGSLMGLLQSRIKKRIRC